MRNSIRRPALRPFHLLCLLLTSLTLLAGPALGIDVDRDCAAAYGSAFVPVTGTVSKSVVYVSRPSKGVLKRDPAYGSCIYRATNHSTETGTSFARNDYSRRQAFNANNTRFIVYGYGGSWHLYNAVTLQRIRTLAFHGTAEPQWDATDPYSLYFLPSGGGMTLSKLNVETNVATVAANFTGRLPWSGVARVWTRGEGGPSANSRYWCFMAENSSSGMLGLFTYDLVTNTIIGKRTTSVRPNHVSMSPSGKWCVVSDTTVWNATFTTSRLLFNGSDHNDLAIGADGRDYYVYTNQQGNGYITMIDLETGTRTSMTPTWIDGTTTSLHISGKAFAKPGWILVSTYKHVGSFKWAHESVYAVQMKSSPKIIRLAHHRVYVNGYWTQPHASVSRDFSHVLYNSNWDSTSSMDVDAYLIRLYGWALGADTVAPVAVAKATVASGTITLAATATDNAAVRSVEFMVDGVYKGSDSSYPYSYAISAGSLASGNHSLVAIAYDAAGNAGKSKAVSFTPTTGSLDPTLGDTTAPKVTPGISVVVDSITMKATATDNLAVTKVDFYVDGYLKGSDTSAPYSLWWNTSGWWPGSTHTLVVKARDAAGNVGTSSMGFTAQ